MHKLWLLRSTNSTLFGNFYLSSGQKIMWLHKIRQSVRSTNYLYFALLSPHPCIVYTLVQRIHLRQPCRYRITLRKTCVSGLLPLLSLCNAHIMNYLILLLAHYGLCPVHASRKSWSTCLTNMLYSSVFSLILTFTSMKLRIENPAATTKTPQFTRLGKLFHLSICKTTAITRNVMMCLICCQSLAFSVVLVRSYILSHMSRNFNGFRHRRIASAGII